MSCLRRVGVMVLLTLGLFCHSGCLSKPYLPGQDLGTLSLRLQRAETSPDQKQFSVMAHYQPIKKVTVIISSKKTVITKTVDPYVEGDVITIGSIYPGSWQIEVKCYDADDQWFLYGVTTKTIQPGENAELLIIIRLAPGELSITMDVAPLLAAGYDASRGRLYVYEDPATDRATIFDLILEGKVLKNREPILLPPGTYNAQIYIPNKSNSFYESDYILFDIITGQIESYALTADASLVVAGLVDLPPATPENFEVRMANGQPLLGWDPVLDADLAGYNVYRTNRDGRFVLLAQVGNDTCVYHDREVKIADYAQSRLGYAVSSYDQGGNNSLWTPTLYWPFDEE
ncbi:MAG: hypothetical protein GX073_04575 [Firmicutes bacterium]|nr:hypothetical protein [Bacillota bacterium]